MKLAAAGTVAFGVGLLAPAQVGAFAEPSSTEADQANTPLENSEAVRPDINPYDRDVEITAPLQFNQRILGELPVLLTSDDRFQIDSDAFLAIISPLLTPQAHEELAQLIGQRDRFLPEDVASEGIVLDYDAEQLAVLVLKIAPEKRSVEELYRTSISEEPGSPPLPFSAYVNISSSLSHLSQSEGLDKPEFFFNGAARYRNFVFETDAQLRRDFISDDYLFERRYARAIYDEPEDYRRWFAGDIDPEVRGRQGFFRLGGVGVVRQKRRFDAFRQNVFSGGRQLVLQEQSVVRVLRNGLLQREFTLDAGQYDISNLPLDTGSNNILIDVQGLSGGRQSYNYEAYLDTIDLEPGDHEYGAYIGLLDDAGFSDPDYSDRTPVFTGFYRKAFMNRPAIGIGLQLSQDVQNASGQTQFLLANSARLRLDGGLSRTDTGLGYAATIGYDQVLGGADGYDTLTFVLDYASARYSTVGRIDDLNPISWSLNAGYSKRLGPELFVTTSAAYRRSRSPTLNDAYSLSSIANHRISRAWSIQIGANYVKSGFIGGGRSDGFGIFAGLIWQPSYDRRAEARYDSARKYGSLRYQKSVSNLANSLGYSFSSNYNDGDVSLGGQMDYVANRFDASVSHTAFGNGFDSIGDSQITTLRVSTALAYAGGKFAVGRRINDSFALVHPHDSLDERPAIVGDTLEGGRFLSKSGALGPAVHNNLTSYVNQSVRYDIIDPPIGYDIGEGVERVRPAYKSGYVIEVGTAEFVSALGTLVTANGEPLALVSGILRRSAQPESRGEAFFTNTVGRFAMMNLEPGVEYVVNFNYGGPQSFTFRVPEDNKGLLDLGVLRVSTSGRN
ncbi:hypothetical protein GRI69_14295 [Erythrobacter vulgaris]|uniref:Fimbria/pilus outer membrane usher protein n=1 Tax=Qipengyuania vulgaris TaxID=291985 RepID=A0A844XWE5_9SPHN|nr:hypothetical protein [Qipengyuania vulgaris]MXO49423.1 hypothetical protein [Qipengyuania vulgaris]